MPPQVVRFSIDWVWLAPRGDSGNVSQSQRQTATHGRNLEVKKRLTHNAARIKIERDKGDHNFPVMRFVATASPSKASVHKPTDASPFILAR